MHAVIATPLFRALQKGDQVTQAIHVTTNCSFYIVAVLIGDCTEQTEVFLPYS